MIIKVLNMGNMILRYLYAISFVSIMIGQGCTHAKQPLYAKLTIDYLNNPIGIENQTPLMSWQYSAGSQTYQQSAYQILVASSPEKLLKGDADCWDSGKVGSSQSLHIPYAGKTLESAKRYYWKVRTWGQHGNPGDFSGVNHWETGLLKEDDWKATWISAVEETDSVPPMLPAPYFRKEFQLPEKIASARLYISGLGYYEAFINGKKVGDQVLDPAMTRYDKRVKYVSYDVGEFLKEGVNAIGVVLGNGWYNQHTREAWDFDKAPWRSSPALLCQLTVSGEDGRQVFITSDGTWKFSTGPIIFDGIHNGETYDARLENDGWHLPGFDDSNWNAAMEVKGPAGKLSAQLMPPIRITDTIAPAKTWQINDTVTMIDLGQNITGWASIRVKGPRGSMVTLRYGERIFNDGTLDQKELSRFIRTGDTQTGRYIIKGEGIEQWHPVFTYHGFQFMEVTLSDPAIEILDIQGHVVHTDLKENGHFNCSNDLFIKIHKNLKWSFLGNYHGYPTDCPHREKMGWSGDALLVAETGLYNFDMVRAYLKWTDDFTDEQQPSGQLPGIIPTSGWGYTYGKDPQTRDRGYGPQWEGAFMEIPWQMYLFTGDTSIITRYYGHFKKYVDYLTEHSAGYLLNFGIDDHKQLEPLTQGPYLSSAFYYRFTQMLSKMASIAGFVEDARKYADLSRKIKQAFNKRYVNAHAGTYDHGGQAPLAIALYFGLTEEPDQPVVLQNLLKKIEENNGHIDAGVVGTKAVINTLLMFGEERILFEMANKRDFPGWGYWIEELGATTLFQNWDGSQSRNHIMFGSIGDYFYKGLAGIILNEEYPGFKHFMVKPSVKNDISRVEAGYDSPYGRVESNWYRKNSGIEMHVTVPPGTSADIYVPATADSKIIFIQGTLTGNPEYREGFQIFKAKSGSYVIHSNGLLE
jgi:alpha-L-rhamnosidase